MLSYKHLVEKKPIYLEARVAHKYCTYCCIIRVRNDDSNKCIWTDISIKMSQKLKHRYGKVKWQMGGYPITFVKENWIGRGVHKYYIPNKVKLQGKWVK